MEKKIKQNYRMRWRPLWLVVGVMSCVFLVLFIAAMFVKKLSLVDLMPGIIAVAVLPAGVAILQKLSRGPNRFCSEWILRDEGLERIRSSVEREIILWKQIKRMFWTSLGGLIVLYQEIPEPGEKPSRELKRGMLLVEKADATVIAEWWRKNCPVDEKERARGRTRRRQIGAGFMVLGLVITCVVAPLDYRAYQSYQWPSVEGKVVSLQYELSQNSKSLSEAWVSFEYTVDGSKYQSGRFRPLGKSYRDGTTAIKAFVKEHREGMPIKVYYDPKRPADSVLMQGPEWGIWGPLLAIGPLLVILGWLVRAREIRDQF